MSISNLFKPRWKHSSASVRREAVRTLANQRQLLEIAKSDPDDTVRQAAAECIVDPKWLLELAKYSEGAARKALVSRVNDEQLLAELAIRYREDTLYGPAIDKLHHPGLIARVARTADSDWARVQAICRIDDQSVLLELVDIKEPEAVQRCAVQRIADQTTLEEIARSHPRHFVRCDAAGKLTDPVLLTSVACAKDPDNRWDIATTAVDRLEDVDLLRQVVREAKYEMARLNAAKKLADADILTELAVAGLDMSTRRLAVESLAAMGADSALQNLVLSLDDPELRREAIVGLRATDVLLELTRSGDKECRTDAYSRLRSIAPELAEGGETADARTELIEARLGHLVFAEGYPFNAAAFNQGQELSDAIEQLVAMANSGNAKARSLLKAVHDHALGCIVGVYAMHVSSLHRGTLRIACAKRLARDLAEFTGGQFD